LKNKILYKSGKLIMGELNSAPHMDGSAN